MLKLIALAEHLKNPATLKQSGIKCNPERIDFWAESGKPEYLGETSSNGVYLFDHEYRAKLVFEEVAGDIELLIGAILCWLRDNDEDRDHLQSSDVEWSGDPYDDGTSDLEVTLSFYEKVHFVLAPDGYTGKTVTWKGQPYYKEVEEIDVAEELDEPLIPTVTHD